MSEEYSFSTGKIDHTRPWTLADDPLRNTGRTTALLLKTISEALLSPHKWVEFVDHYARLLEMYAKQCGLNYFEVRRRKGRVFFISSVPENIGTRNGCEAYKMPLLPELPQ